LVFIFGLMGYTGVPIYLTVAVMPVLLTAMCVTDEIHVFSRYFTLLREQPKASRAELVGQTMDEMCRPVANTTLTTAIGFVSFAFSPLGPVQAFGIFTALGVLFSLVWSIAVIPAMLMLIKPEVLVRGRGRESGREALCGAAAFARLAGIVVRHRGWVVGLVAGVVALTPLGLRRLIVQDSWIEGFDPGSEFRRATRLVNAQFHGMHLLFVCVDARRDLSVEVLPSAFDNGRFLVPAHVVRDPEELAGSPLLVTAEGLPGSAGREWRSHIEMVLREGTNLALRVPLDAPVVKQQAELARAARLRLELVPRTQLRPEAVRQMADLAAFIRERRDCAVGGVLGPGEYLSTTRVILRPRDPQARVLPQNAGETKSLWDYYRIARGPERLRQVVDPNSSRALLTVFLKGGNFRDTDRLLGAIRAYEQQHLAREGIRLGFAGDVAVSQSLITSIVRTQLRSLGWSLAGIYLCTALLGRSWRWGLYCVLPSTLAVLINFAVMGGVGIPLGVATSMFAGMTLGIGVDFAIHALEGHRQARMARAGATEALAAALSRTGPAVLVNTLSICLGFGVLLFSQVPANARLALLVVLGLGNSLIATLLVLPALLSRWPLNVSRAPTGEIEVDRR
jgi:predicted RND superfamily exporter protein